MLQRGGKGVRERVGHCASDFMAGGVGLETGRGGGGVGGGALHGAWGRLAQAVPELRAISVALARQEGKLLH